MYRRIFALILAFVMAFSLVPVTAFATEEEQKTEPVVTEPMVSEPKATEPKATEPQATEPKATEPKATEPKATEPQATEPKATEPKATEPQTTEPKATEPKATEPQATEPKATEPVATEPAATEPKATEPVATEPAATEPKATEPQVTEPKATEPKATEPKATEPKTTEPTASQKTQSTNPDKRGMYDTPVTIKFTLEFPENSGLTEEDVESITVVLKKEIDEYWEDYAETEISAENGWTAAFDVRQTGNYCVTLRGGDIDGYRKLLGGNEEFDVSPSDESISRSYSIFYVRNDDVGSDAKLTISFAFAEDSLLKDTDIGDIYVVAENWDTGETTRATLTSANGRKATLSLEPGDYNIRFNGYDKKGYACDIHGNEEMNISLSAGERVSEKYTLKYVKDEAKLRISLDFAEDSALQDTDIGDITVSVYNSYAGENYSAVLTSANGRTAVLTVPTGSYGIEFDGFEINGYVCDIEDYGSYDDDHYLTSGEEASRRFTLKYVEDRAKLTVSLDFAEDSAFGDADFGDITVNVSQNGTGNTYSAALTSENNRTMTATLPSGEYYISLSDHEKDGYHFELEESDGGSVWINLEPGADVTEVYTAKYVKDEVKLTISLELDEESDLDDANIGNITAAFYFDDMGDVAEEPSGTIELTKENGRTATVTLPSGSYDLRFSGYEEEGYVCNLKDSYSVDLELGEETSKTYTLSYTKDEAKLSVALDFGENSAFKDADIGEILAKVYDGNPGNGGTLVETLSLTQENSRTAETTLPSGSYYVYFEGYEKADHYCSLEKYEIVWLTEGEKTWFRREVMYVRNEAKISVSLGFADDSALGTDDVGDITAQIYRTSWDDIDEKPALLVGSVVLTRENERKGELTIKLDGYFCADESEMDYGYWVSDSVYELRFAGGEVDGYRHAFVGADYSISLYPGDEDGWNAAVKYAEEKHSITVDVVLTEDSDIPADKLKDVLLLNLEEKGDGLVNDVAYHNGNAAFTYTFTDLPASGFYRLSVQQLGTAVLKSFTCEGDVLSENLEDGQLNFALDSDCLITVVLSNKKSEGGLTIIARFAEDSVLQAEDFPNGISLRPLSGPAWDVKEMGAPILFSPENNWTNALVISSLYGMTVEQVDGYMGSVGVVDIYGEDIYPGVDASDCPTTVYAYIHFSEYRTSYLDVKFVILEDSALKGAEIGSLVLNVFDGAKEVDYEFSEETGWERRLTLESNYNGYEWNATSAVVLKDFERPGYSYVGSIVNYQTTWIPGNTEELEIWVRYISQPGKLVVQTTSGAYGRTCEATITVTDADGNVVAKKDTKDHQCVIELPEEGDYTVSQKAIIDKSIADKLENISFFADEAKTIHFKPSEGATLTLLNEYRVCDGVAIKKFFDEGSELGPEDFPNGITVLLTEASGAFSRTCVLNEENGWGSGAYIPSGIYTVTEIDADKEGYERTTLYAYSEWDWTTESLRGWSSRGADGAQETVDTALTGGPYHIKSSESDSKYLHIYNSYEKIQNNPEDDPENDPITGSITITAGDGFWIYGGEKLPGSPGTGYEADEYTYRIVIDGEEQIVNLKPGEEITIDGIAAGTEYTVTPVLPEDYPWNAAATPITGTIGGETNSEAELNVKASFDNDYYYIYEECALTIVKMDELTGDDLPGAKFGLYSDEACTKRMAVATTGKDGTCTFTITEAGTYYIKELKAPTDYHVKSEDVKIVTIKEDWELIERENLKVLRQELIPSVKGLLDQENGFGWINLRERVDISVTKKFKYDADLERPESVTIALYQDGELYDTVKLSKANNWKYVWEDMPLGFEYTVDEVNVAKGYHKKISSKGYDFTVVNSGYWNPQTGDDSMIALWICAATLSLVTLAALAEKKRRQRA